MSRREYQIALLGATGFTGRLVADYLARNAPPSLSWALVGRSAAKLKEIQDQLRSQPCPPRNILVADTANQSQLDAVTSQSHVICTTVGPYALYGDLVVESCITQRCHYCDLTGEVAWIKKNVERHHTRAQNAGVYLVHCSGFDSIPSDLGTLFVVNYIRDKLNAGLNHPAQSYQVGDVKSIFYPMKGGVSGGTIASILNMMKEPWSVLKDVSNPQCIMPQFVSSSSSSSSSSTSSSSSGTGLVTVPAPPADLHRPEYDAVAKRWTAPFVMNAINSRVVWRSSVLHKRPYGPEFQYREVMGTRSFVESLVVSVALVVGMALLSFSVGRTVLGWFLPKPGEGPSKEEMEKGFFKVTFYATAKGTGGAHDRRVVATVVGNKDPGYADTSKMLAETAMCLAEASVKGEMKGTAGVTTPAAAVGEELIERLNKVDIKFEVDKDEEI